ncbi:MAG TPA: hypothetical protein VGC34_14975 [Steroidobacteraceae bacterium]
MSARPDIKIKDAQDQITLIEGTLEVVIERLRAIEGECEEDVGVGSVAYALEGQLSALSHLKDWLDREETTAA